MTKKHFIALADAIKNGNGGSMFEPVHLHFLADFCASQNPRFNRSRWLDYIAGKCGKGGGEVKKAKPKTLGPCSCKRGQERDNCAACEGTGKRIDFAAIRNAK